MADPGEVPPGPSPAPSLRQQAVRGSLWTIVGYGAAMVLRLAVNVLLTHLLFPAAFGLLTLVMIFVMGLQMFSDIGLAPSIIRSPRGEERDFRNTAWTMQVIRGFVLWLALCAVAWPASRIYQAPQLVTLLPVAGLITVISGFCSSAVLVLNRRMMIGRITVFELLTPIPGTLAMCLWAYLSQSVWALVGGQLIQQAGRTLFSYMLIPGHRDRLAWDRDAARELFSFGRWIFLSTLVTFLASQADRIMLGRLISKDDLGIYGIAVGLTLLPQDIAARLTSVVQYPALAQSHQEPARMFQWLRRSRDGLLGIGLAMTVAIAVGAPLFFALLYDHRYQSAAWMAQFISVAVWIGMLQTTSDRALLALGDSRTLAVSNIARVLTTVVASLTGFYAAGLVGFLVGLSAGAAAGHLCIAAALARRGYATAWADFGYSALFAACLLGDWLLTRWLSGIWIWGGIDLGSAVAAVLVLAPLGAWSAWRLYGTVVRA